ncbi:semaphorin-1A-like isoform X1 [Amphibalanus amphitrite]|uniref:semaphorin-1A-like isoform X1 n=1 Tax=Amphibalanus amphitrite TaxID=1232801 RepID=UPI001C9206D4|nr:semaphorin-1A-like isoform X1 [Amphibalanus amphitrite]
MKTTAVLVTLLTTTLAWQDDLVPLRTLPLDDEDVLRFRGNTSHSDHFKLLEKDGNSLLIGARNIVFNISLTDFTEHREERLEWYSPEHDVRLCIMKGLSEEACHNYVRVLAKKSDGELFVCGTNSYNPKCRSYRKQPELGYVAEGNDVDGKGICPYDPHHNSTVTFVDDQLYAGTVADFAGSDPLIYRHPLRTEQFELKQLNAPSFVGSIDHGDFVYFFFRETAVEYINCGKRVYSRVARVCKNDKGGSYKYRNKWTSFLKSRLNCSIPGEYPFYFDEIQSISSVQTGVHGGQLEDVLYAVFTTPVNSIAGSAVCAFRLTDVMDTFEGNFKHQDDMNSNWLPTTHSQVPEPRPGRCVNDSRSLPDVHLNFIRSHPLMDSAVPTLHGQPLLMRTSLHQRFTKIAVDPQVRAADGTLYDVLFIATDDGRVLKAVNVASGAARPTAEPLIVEELAVFPTAATITNLLVSRQPGQPPRLIVVTDDEIRAVPLSRCGAGRVGHCSACVRLRDPYCAWDEVERLCRPLADWPAGVEPLQNVTGGYHPRCPRGEDREPKILFQEATTAASPSTTQSAPVACDCAGSAADPSTAPAAPGGEPSEDEDDGNELDREKYEADEGQRVLDIVERTKSFQGAVAKESRYSGRPSGVYTAETLAIAVVSTCLLAVLVGFGVGWCVSRRYWRARGEPYYETPHLDRQSRMKQLEAAAAAAHVVVKPDNRCERNFHTEPAFLVNNGGKQINLVVNQTKNSNGKNANSAADSKPVQKVRKMYL